MSIQIKTVDQLPELSVGQVLYDDYLKVSHKIDGSSYPYVSRKTKVGVWINTISSVVDREISTKYKLSVDCMDNVFNALSTVNERVDTISTELEEKIEGVDTLIKNSTSYFGISSDYKSAIIPSSAQKITSDKTTFYTWKFEQEGDGYVSEEKTVSISAIGEQDSTQCGTLICYGWITAPANLSPALAYVVAEGCINDQWVMLQLQPWIIGSKSSVTQYVSFNLPVRDGLRIRFRTGFQINDWSHSLIGQGLILNPTTDLEVGTSNSIIGYIVK